MKVAHNKSFNYAGFFKPAGLSKAALRSAFSSPLTQTLAAMSQNPELLDYIEFFETEPEWLHDMGWFYGARFVTHRGDDTITATIAPDEAEFYLQWHQGQRLLLTIKLVLVTTWLLQNKNNKEQLFLKTSSDRGETMCTLTLKPDVSVDLEGQW